VGLKIDAETVAADLAVEVAFPRAEIVDLLIMTRKLGGEVTVRPFFFPIILLPKAFSVLTWLVCNWSALDNKLE
jgi:hypothetical protein